MTINDFFTACEQHDWLYNFSDDHGVWRRGEDQRLALTAEMDGDPFKAAIFDAFQQHKLSGPAFGTPKAAAPERNMFVPQVSTFPGKPVEGIEGQDRLF